MAKAAAATLTAPKAIAQVIDRLKLTTQEQAEQQREKILADAKKLTPIKNEGLSWSQALKSKGWIQKAAELTITDEAKTALDDAIHAALGEGATADQLAKYVKKFGSDKSIRKMAEKYDVFQLERALALAKAKAGQ